MIERTFKDIAEGKIEEVDHESYLASLGYSSGKNWKDLLLSKRVLIISEAGSGKTYECRNQCEQLLEKGQPAFFLELASLSNSDMRTLLSFEEEERLDQWLSSQSEVATFFLDSYDELKLSLGSFELALKKLAKSLKGQLRRARIVITTRPIPFDEQLVRKILPVPSVKVEVEVSAEAFAQIALHGTKKETHEDENEKPSPDWRTVALLPFSENQIVEFAQLQGVTDPAELLKDLKKRNALDFAKRPQDLIELSADWRDYKRIRTHRDQIAGNIDIKLKPRTDRKEPAELSMEKAKDGASRIALAMMLTRRLTIRHSVESDRGGSDAAFDPRVILPEWTDAELKALLERPLFGFASYGRVRFHHRSVAEYLASERLRALRAQGMAVSALKRLIFIETKGKMIVRHSKRAIAAWLALSEPTVFEILRKNEPEILFNEGDPESLTTSQRNQALRAFVKRHSQGGWRGLNIPGIQIHRFASLDLAGEINRLWQEGIENSEIREILLRLIDSGQIQQCSDIAFGCASDPKCDIGERLEAIDALAAVDDARLPALVAKIADDSPEWSERFARIAVMRLFPKHMSIAQMFKILPRMKSGEGRIGDLSWFLPNVITDTDWQPGELETIRDGLDDLISGDFHWQKTWPHFFSSKSHLSGLLAVTCLRGLEGEVTTEWLHASIKALTLVNHHDPHKEVFTKLTEALNNLPADQSCELFWESDAFFQSLHSVKDAGDRFAATTLGWDIRLQRERDLQWIKRSLIDAKLSHEKRAVALEAALRVGSGDEEWVKYITGLKSLVDDVPILCTKIENWIEQSNQKQEPAEWEVKQAKWKKEAKEKEARDLASWLDFWKFVSEDPETAFSNEKAGNTAWNFWHAMSRAGSRGRESGWNRKFIEQFLGKVVADRLRKTLMNEWRKYLPTLTSERPDDAKGTYLVVWQLGLAGIYAESEDPRWATKLTANEARLAARYATIELNSLPGWMETLVKAHAVEVEEILGAELETELSEKTENNFHSMLLQNISHSSEAVIALFLPRVRSWLKNRPIPPAGAESNKGEIQRLCQATDFLAKHGDFEMKSLLREIARKRMSEESTDLAFLVWLPLILRLDPEFGVGFLEDQFQGVAPSKLSDAVRVIGRILGDRHGGIGFSGALLRPQLLLRLMRLVYKQVRVQDDARHTGAYSPDDRDNAECARNNIVNALLALKGEEGWAVKQEMASDPCCAHFRDRILAMAEESWAEECDGDAFSDRQATDLDKTGEALPSTNEAMFSMMVDRLGDLDEILLLPDTPRDTWAGIDQEKQMRREIARALSHLSNGKYKIDQEAVTADEKETDIRLSSVVSEHVAVIELKLADGRPAKDLLATLEDQLVKKYMASASSRSGCLLITLAKERKWEYPDKDTKIDFTELVELLRIEAARIITKLGGTLRLHVHALDLRPRLPTESAKKK